MTWNFTSLLFTSVCLIFIFCTKTAEALQCYTCVGGYKGNKCFNKRLVECKPQQNEFCKMDYITKAKMDANSLSHKQFGTFSWMYHCIMTAFL